MTPRQAVRAIGLMGLLLPALALARPRSPAQDTVEDALAFANADREKSIVLLESAISEGLSARDLPLVQAHLAEQHRLAGHADDARRLFTEVASGIGKGALPEVGSIGLVLLDAGVQATDRDLRILERASDKDLLDTQNADRYTLLAKEAAQRNDAPKLASYSKKALSFAEADEVVEERISRTLRALLPGEAPKPSDEPPLERAWAAYAAGNPDAARRAATQATEGKPESHPDVIAARGLLRLLDANAPIDPNKIVVLLPMSGKYEGVGKQVKQALELGFKGGTGTAKMEFVDTGATPESAVAAFEKATLTSGAIAVVGPLLSEETPAVVSAATSLRVPIVTLSQSLDSEPTPTVFVGFATLDEQAARLAAYVIGERGMKSFAIFAPKSPYGERATTAFTAAVESLGGKVTVKQSYDPDATDLLPFAKALGRKDYKARYSELQHLKAEAKERGGNPDSVVLPPVIDFDAIFIPDSAGRIPLACAALAYEEFPMGDFQPTRKSKFIPLLGLSGWNQANLVVRGGPYVRQAIFTDVFLPGDSNFTAFSAKYAEAIGRQPTPLEAMAHDVGKLVAAAAASRPATREAFTQALQGVSTTGLITGATGFDPVSHAAKHNVRILTIRGENIDLVTPAAPDAPQ